MGRFNCNCYSFERRVIKDHHLQNITTDDGTLYAGYHRTKILPQDLPAWYVYGRYYKCFGYMNTKGITDLLYEPYHSSNHFSRTMRCTSPMAGRLLKIQSRYATAYTVRSMLDMTRSYLETQCLTYCVERESSHTMTYPILLSSPDQSIFSVRDFLPVHPRPFAHSRID